MSTANLKMGEVISALVKELSCHDCAKYVCNDASLHSKCCDKDEFCEFDLETRPVNLPDEELEFDMEIDSGLCCLVHASKK